MSEAKLIEYLVKSDGDTVRIFADKWDIDGSGLRFYRGQDLVGWFSTFEHFHDVSAATAE